MVTTYVLNLSDPEIGIINLAPLTFASSTTPLKTLGELPDTGPAILYIVAHGVPNALRMGSTIIAEADLAHQLQKIRGKEPTLVIFDSCFAESLRRGANFEWPPNFILIFSCQAHERTWHTGGIPHKRESLFSRALDEAVAAHRGKQPSWRSLQDYLVREYDGLQRPSVHVHARSEVSPQHFGF